MPSSMTWRLALGGLAAALAVACGSSGSDVGPVGSGGSGGSGATGGSGGSAGAGTGGTGGGTGGSAGASAGGTGGSAGAGTGGTAGTGGSGGTGGSAGFTTVFTIVFENHDYNEIVGSANAPFINGIIDQFGLATNYMDSGTHPSLPNYLYMISGDTQYVGIIDVGPTTYPFPVDKDNLGSQFISYGVPWRFYEENMATPCNLVSAGTYAARHDPFLYFTNIQKGASGLCAKYNVDYTSFGADVASGKYRYMYIVPNLINDGHDPQTDPVAGMKQSDAWLQSELPKIMGTQAYQTGGVIFITWDEAEGRNGNSKDQIPMIVVSPKLVSPGFKTNHLYSHASYLATVEDLFGLPRLGAAVKADTMMEFFQP